MENSEFSDYVSWFEIPVLNIKRAVTFYNHIYNFDMEIIESPVNAMAFFPAVNGIGGALVMSQGCLPSDNGILLYLNGGEDLNIILNRIEEAGGRIIMTKTLISDDAGFYAIFIDSEGNKLALHSKY
jgi:predicted enzyme related to lactoylglutathione lyase